MKNINIHRNIKEIRDFAFFRCEKLENVNVDERLDRIKISSNTFLECDNIRLDLLMYYLDKMF